VRIICRNDQTEQWCDTPRGEDPYVRVHDQNNLDTGYFHFDLGEIDPSSEITQARFQLDSQTNSWGDTTISVFAIMDPALDWDLNVLPETEIIGANAPQSDWESFAWTGDPNNQQRFNVPTPFLDEGNRRDSVVRELSLFLLIDNEDPLTDDAGNSSGGYVDGTPGAAGSADGDDNIWPVKNVVDEQITDLIRWKLGQNPGYSAIDPTDAEVTLLVRTDSPEAGGDNGFVRFISKESTFLEGPLDLAPARIVLSGDIIVSPTGPPLQAGDADQDLDFDQMDLVKVQIAAKYLTGQPATWGEGDWNGAPGGQPGDPPLGNGLFDQMDIVAALAPAHYLTGPYDAVSQVTEQEVSSPLSLEGGERSLVDAPALAAAMGRGDFSAVDLVYVPEPSAMALLLVGLLIIGLGHPLRDYLTPQRRAGRGCA
jgi:hypothetical protein